MIYLDNCATTLQKPPQVADAVKHAIEHLGNAGRSFYEPAMRAARMVGFARNEIAALTGVKNPLHVAFTSGATESLNLALYGLICPEDTVITTTLEHNSVLRPLYNIGCKLRFIECDSQGSLRLEQFVKLIDKNTRFLVCTHGSNLLGSITNAAYLYEICKQHGIAMILDVAQTLGSAKVCASMADVFCFTGHKSLMGPLGTGGIICEQELGFRPIKTGGTGTDSFAKHQGLGMPDVFEAGSSNAHSLAGLREGAAFVRGVGLEAIAEKERILTAQFLDAVLKIDNVQVYGATSVENRLPVVALNVGDLPAEDVALQLWEGWQIAIRAGSHCAPLVHGHFGTEHRGMVRFSFGWFNTQAEVQTTIEALCQIAKGN